MKLIGRLPAMAAAVMGLLFSSTAAARASSWSIQPTPNPSGAQFSSLKAVSCASEGACIAVGSAYFGTSAGTDTLAERWDGSTWTLLSSRTPAGAYDSQLSGVSCTVHGICMAVGFHGKATGPTRTLAERWDGSAWSIQTTPKLKRGSALNSVSCVSKSSCVAVGYTGRHALIERWNGRKWSIPSSPTPKRAADSTLGGVSCTTPRACTAVGFYGTRKGFDLTLGERWNGRRWSIQTTQEEPGGSGVSQLWGVSCAPSEGCTAVGRAARYSQETGTTYVTLVERWYRRHWSLEYPRSPSASYAGLLGVSCPSGSLCTAVGQADDADGNPLTLAERRNGGTWRVQPTPSGGSDLSGVSCPSTSSCIAVGDGSGTLAELWSGS